MYNNKTHGILRKATLKELIKASSAGWGRGLGPGQARQSPGRGEGECVTYPRESDFHLTFEMTAFGDIKQLAHPYHLINLLLSLSFIISRYIPSLCKVIFLAEQCGELTMVRVTNIFFSLALTVSLYLRCHRKLITIGRHCSTQSRLGGSNVNPVICR